LIGFEWYQKIVINDYQLFEWLKLYTHSLYDKCGEYLRQNSKQKNEADTSAQFKKE
jgi:hypothetical protein